MSLLADTPKDVFAFWTTQRISTAVPVGEISDNALDQKVIEEDLKSPAYSPTSFVGTSASQTAGQRLITDGGTPRVVYYPDSKVLSPAYNSVGKLLIEDGTKLGRSATAFYVGNSTVLTVAHAFWDEKFKATNECKVSFIPGICGVEKIHGQFHVREFELHRNYSPRCSSSDICKAIIGSGDKEGSIDNLNLLPFNIVKNRDDLPKSQIDRSQNLVCLGYPYFVERDQVGNQPSYVNRLMGVRGIFHYYQGCNKSGLNVKDAQVLKGISGGPWIIEETNNVLGMQAGNSITVSGLEVSPRFTTDLFSQFNI